MTLKALCEHCRGRLKAADNSFVGRRVRCPRCGRGTRFRPVTRPADDPDRSEVEGEPPGRSNAVAWVGFAALATATLTLALVLGRDAVGGWGREAAEAFSELMPEQAAEPVLKWLPERPDVAMVVRAEDVLRSRMMRSVRQEAFGLEGIASWERSYGVDAMKMEWLAAARGGGDGGEWDELNAEEPASEDWVLVMRHRVPPDPERLKEDREEARHAGQTYWRVRTGIDPEVGDRHGKAHFFPDERTVVYAREETLKRLMTRGPRPRPEWSNALETAAYVTFAVSTAEDSAELWSQLPLREGGGGRVEEVEPPEGWDEIGDEAVAPRGVDSTRPVTARGSLTNLGASVAGAARFEFSSEAAAEVAATQLRGGLAKLRQDVAEMDTRFMGRRNRFGWGGGFLGNPVGLRIQALPDRVLPVGSIGTDSERDAVLTLLDGVEVSRREREVVVSGDVAGDLLRERLGLD